MKKMLCILSISGFVQATVAQDTLNFPPPLIPVSVYAIETKESINVDGKLNEAVWPSAPIISDFFRMEPRQGGTYLHQTFVRILFDRSNIYFGVFCRDRAGKRGVRVQDLRRDFIYSENDVFYLQLDPQNLKRYCASFQTTPFGAQRHIHIIFLRKMEKSPVL